MRAEEAALVARLKKTETQDRELDLDLLNAISPHRWRWLDRKRETITNDRYGPGAIGNPVCSLDSFTGSLDAAVGLFRNPPPLIPSDPIKVCIAALQDRSAG